jgi:hypothetical protein
VTKNKPQTNLTQLSPRLHLLLLGRFRASGRAGSQCGGFQHDCAIYGHCPLGVGPNCFVVQTSSYCNMFSQVASPLSFYTPMVVPEPPPTQPMDPSPSDAYAIFIHPPFTTFPDSHLHPDGLSYAVLAANPDWFLDPHDFISVTSSNPTAIQYPIRLEPPRKRNLKALGSDGVTESGEPRFRCTFCRKNYAGENAKSMWRRHVVKRHGIVMSNRRDVKRGVSRGGRRANSE